MFMMKGLSSLFISLAVGYVLCILAEKQKNLLRTVGYTLGIAIIALSLLAGLIESSKCCMMGKMASGPKAMKCMHMNWRHK